MTESGKDVISLKNFNAHRGSKESMSIGLSGASEGSFQMQEGSTGISKP